MSLLVLHLVIRHFRYFVEGRRFIAFTDHKPLVLLFVRSLILGHRASNGTWLAFLSTPLTCSTSLTKTTMWLMRCPELRSMWSTRIWTLISPQMASAQQADAEITRYKTTPTDMALQTFPVGASQTDLICDVSTGHPRPLVPVVFRRTVFNAIHGLSHPSIRTTRAALMLSKFVWHGIGRQVSLWARNCIACQRAKVHRNVRAPLQSFKVPPRHFEHINVDLDGSLPTSRGYSMLFTIVDRFTR